MKSKLFLVASLATLLVACSKDSGSIDDSTPISKGNNPVATQQPVTFGAYVNRATTRAGAEGELIIGNPAAGQVNLQTEGFGVLAYYTDDKPYSSSSQPNFMYNTKVSGANWEYEPIRYWPNENSANDASEGIDRVSFFAYAPYVQVNPVSGMVNADDESGIVYMNRNGAVGDPFVNYHVNFNPSKQVDFCWGVNKTTGKPNINMTKQGVNEKVEFQFYHALAALNVQVDAVFDALGHPADPTAAEDDVAAKTKIYVRSVTFEGFADKGSFNLNMPADKVMWYDVAGNDYIDGSTVIVHDGRTNGYEGGLGSEAVNELPKGLNPVIVQSAPYDDPTLTAGVTKTSVNLFDNTSNEAPVYVIPTGQPLKMTIVYDVETQVDGLPGYLSDGVKHGTSVENKITKTIKLNDGSIMKLEAGKKYTINLHLGMASVKYDAEIADWDNYAASTNLPLNTVTLGEVSITDGTAALNALSMWKNETMTSQPMVKVQDTQGNDITDICTITWESSDTDVAEVDNDGVVTPKAPGTSDIKVTVTLSNQTSSKSYTLAVNEVTGLSLSPATSGIILGGNVDVKATLTINGGGAVYGSITNWPTVSWSSDYEKVTVSPTSGPAGEEVAAIVATTTATADANAVADQQAVITATIDTPFAASTITATSTLTCLAKIGVKSVTVNTAPVTVWLGLGATLPTDITVIGTDDNPLTSGVTFSWEAKTPAVATYNSTSGITLLDAGEATFTLTASLEETTTTAASSKTADYTIYVNKVTGISVSPATSNINIGGTLDLQATLAINDGGNSYGTVSSWPTVSWSSNQTKVTVDPTNGTAADNGNSITASNTVTSANDTPANTVATITATVSTDYAASELTATSTLTCVKAPPTGALAGLFSINATGNKVYFSKGNLQYLSSTDTWRFAENQWGYIGNTTSNVTPTSGQNAWMDLFGWGTKTNPTNSSYSGGDYNPWGEWGENAISNGGNTVNFGWYTLSIDEWAYLFNSRESGITINGVDNARYTLADVNRGNLTAGSSGNLGVILFPENYNGPTDNTSSIIWGTINGKGTTAWATKCTTEGWTTLETAGCVFLPVAGYRKYDSLWNDPSVEVGGEGDYWSRTVYNSSSAYNWFFGTGGINQNYPGRQFGYSVRLVISAD
ncbi:MAG: Ig-like domain-containing protein [Bacteroidaceae bacterium]|nr:Ig-like domain-containing protein [Bacteroidaceae bacterium]